MLLNWAITCPGPSLRFAAPVYDDGCLIAVNAAVLHEPAGCPADYWALMDPEVFKSVIDAPFNLRNLIIWTDWNFGNSAEKVAGWKESHREAFRDFLVFTYGDLPKKVDLGANRLWKSYSVFTAVSLAILRGAKVIRVYGADMAGQGYFLPSFENSRTNHSEKRWADETFFFRQAQNACARQGIRLLLERS
jgi:hypothetical protein